VFGSIGGAMSNIRPAEFFDLMKEAQQ